MDGCSNRAPGQTRAASPGHHRDDVRYVNLYAGRHAHAHVAGPSPREDLSPEPGPCRRPVGSPTGPSRPWRTGRLTGAFPTLGLDLPTVGDCCWRGDAQVGRAVRIPDSVTEAPSVPEGSPAPSN